MSLNVEDAEIKSTSANFSVNRAGYETAIGKRSTAYYSESFQLFDENPSLINTSWNWSAFFFGAYWALYRKIYAPAIFAVIALIFLPAIFGGEVFPAILLGVMIFFGVLGNTLYHRKIKRLLSLARIRHRSEDARKIMVRRRGGVNMWVPVAITSIVAAGVLAAVGIPAYQDYKQRLAQSDKKTMALASRPVPQTLQPTPSPPHDLGVIYAEKVKSIRQGVLSGNIPITKAEFTSTARIGEAYWPSGEVASIERNQTWWMQDGFTYIHLVNTTKRNISTISFTYSSSTCNAGGKESEYTAQFIHFFAPGQEGVVELKGAWPSGSGCLTINRIWG